MKFPTTYYTKDGQLYKVDCERVYQGEQGGKPCLMAEMDIEEVKYST